MGCLPLIGQLATLGIAAFALYKEQQIAGAAILIFGLLMSGKVSMSEVLSLLDHYKLISGKKKGTKKLAFRNGEDTRTIDEEEL